MTARGGGGGIPLLLAPLHRPGAGLSGQDSEPGRAALWLGVSPSLQPTAVPPDFPAPPPVRPPPPRARLLRAGHSPISGSGREDRGLPAPRSPSAQSSASRMAAAPRAGRGQQVLGRAPRSRGRRVCLAHPAAPRRHQAPPRPRPGGSGPGPAPGEAAGPPARPAEGPRSSPLRRSRCGARWEPRPGPTGLGDAPPRDPGAGPLPCSLAALPLTSAARVSGLPVRPLGSAGVGSVRAFINRGGAGGQDAPSLRVGGVVVAIAVGGGRELLGRGASRAPPPHVVPARPAVHGRAVRRRAHVGLGRLGCLAHHAAPAQPAAQQRAAAVQDVRQAVALPGARRTEGCEGHWTAPRLAVPTCWAPWRARLRGQWV